MIKLFIFLANFILFASYASASEKTPSSLREIIDQNGEICSYYDAILMVDVWGASGQQTIDSQLLVLQAAVNQELPIFLIEYKCDTELTISSFLNSLPSSYPLMRIRKTTTDSFFETNLADLLKQNGVSQLMIMGGRTNVCIKATVLSGIELGFNFIGSVDILEGGFPSYADELSDRFRIFPF